MTLQPVLDFMLFTGLGLLGIGFFLNDRLRHLFRMSGFALFGAFWAGQAPYFLDYGDIVNACLCLAGLPFFLYMSYHAYLSYRWDAEHQGLRFLAGLCFIAGFVFFLVERIPVITGNVILSVTQQSVWLLNVFGNDYGVGPIDYAGNELLYRTNYAPGEEINVQILGSGIALVFACTAVQSMLIFVGAIFATRASNATRARALLATVLPIHVLNLVRNAGIVYLSEAGIMTAEVAHNYVGKAGSLVALIVLAFVIFRLMPGVLDNMNSLLELPSRAPPQPPEATETSL